MKKHSSFLLGVLLGIVVASLVGILILSEVTQNDWYCPKAWSGTEFQE